MLHDTLPAAAIVHDRSAITDALLAAVAAHQQRIGRRVHGLLMQRAQGGGDCSTEMVLRDIQTGDDYLVSQPTGRDSTACRADPQGFARASAVLRAALAQAPDLVIVNRFGQLEADGGGFRAELLELMAAGVPLLTSVSQRHLEAWQRFTGGAAALAPERDAVDAWLGHALAAPQDAR